MSCVRAVAAVRRKGFIPQCKGRRGKRRRSVSAGTSEGNAIAADAPKAAFLTSSFLWKTWPTSRGNRWSGLEEDLLRRVMCSIWDERRDRA